MKKFLNLSWVALCVLAQNINAQDIWNWTNKASLPQAALGSGARALGVATLNGKIYTVGGLNWPSALSTVLEYDPVSNVWSIKASLLTPRYAPAAAAINGKLYAIGGGEGSGQGLKTALATVEAYDPIANTWTNKASMVNPRYGHQAVTLNGKIYALGGRPTPDGISLASVEEYDPALDTWTPKADMPSPRLSFGATVSNGKIYAVGGGTTSVALAPVYSYDPSTDSWATNASIPTLRGTLAAVSIDGRIIAMGGDNGTPGGSAVVEIYNSPFNAWTHKPNMPTTRNECYAAIIGDNLYVFGGYDQWTMQSAKIAPILNIYTAIELEFLTKTGTVHQIQASPDLSTWTNFDAPIIGDGNYWSKVYSTRGQSRLFFRFSDTP